ncbi:MAG: spore maturation protein [Oscillospiraceae bacterium]|nr:spore maturation protein [Oscillospiraceae bacterium]
MSNISNYILPIFVCLIVVYGFLKKVDVFDAFTEGAKNGFNVFLSILPSLTALFLAIEMLKSSGGTEILTKILSPVGKLLNIPNEVLPMCILSPVSGGGSLSIYESIISEYGPDSYIGRVASVMMGSSETTFYAIAVYYGAVNIKKIRHTAICSLCADFTSFIVSGVVVRILFY